VIKVISVLLLLASVSEAQIVNRPLGNGVLTHAVLSGKKLLTATIDTSRSMIIASTDYASLYAKFSKLGSLQNTRVYLDVSPDNSDTTWVEWGLLEEVWADTTIYKEIAGFPKSFAYGRIRTEATDSTTVTSRLTITRINVGQ
tara:strand:+ start:3645 stop:4073 length:429 start_codon:yes stop_codon:yes gene_type:complete